jgi:hypothetical protein
MVVETREKKISPAVVIVPIIAFGALAMAYSAFLLGFRWK